MELSVFTSISCYRIKYENIKNSFETPHYSNVRLSRFPSESFTKEHDGDPISGP